MEHILLVNVKDPIERPKGYHITHVKDIFSGHNILDAETIFWSVEDSKLPYSGEVTQAQFDVTQFQLQNLRERFDEFFEIGRTLILPSPNFHLNRCILKSDGQNNRVLSFLNCLPIGKIETGHSIGTNLSPANPHVKNFLDNNGHTLKYTMELIAGDGEPLMFVKDTKKVVAKFIRHRKGLILLTPFVSLPRDYQSLMQFLYDLELLIKGLKVEEKHSFQPLPLWTEKYYIRDEKKEIELATELNVQKNELELKIIDQQKKIDLIRNLKYLFAGDGDSLEEVVEYVFREIGFDVSRPENKRDDLIIKFKEKVAVVEIKGTSKSGSERYAAQLEKWVSSYYENNGVSPKGILIVNTYKNELLEHRTDKDFPDQMIPYCLARQHCLLTGLQLLAMFIDFNANAIDFESIIKFLFDTNGVMEYESVNQCIEQ
jgi:hypothetical protein